LKRGGPRSGRGDKGEEADLREEGLEAREEERRA
jgi:hypothetical protein